MRTHRHRQSLISTLRIPRLEPLETRNLLAVDFIALSPADDSGGVAVDSDLVLTFGEQVLPGPGLGNILIKNAVDDSIVEAINVNSDRVTFDGNMVTVDPENDLPVDGELYVEIDAGAFRDTSAGVASAVLLQEDFEGLTLQDSLLGGETRPMNYVLVMEGKLDVQVAGDYTFGNNGQSFGSTLFIDINQDGIDVTAFPNEDEIIFDEEIRPLAEDRLSVCGSEFNGTSCTEVESIDPVTLAVGEYDFRYMFFDFDGKASGEFFYAPGKQLEFDPNVFALVGDDSQGIGVTQEGITATGYRIPVPSVTSINRAEQVVNGTFPYAAGFPATDTLPTADVWGAGNRGRFSDNHELPGTPERNPSPIWNAEGPFGWTRDNSNLPGGGAPEYEGWTFLLKDFWIDQQDTGDGTGQGRSGYTNGVNIVALADPDAYDGFVSINPDLFNASLSTPPIYLNGAEENTATISFASSWRQEGTQTAELQVEFFDVDGNSLSISAQYRSDQTIVVDRERIADVVDLKNGDTVWVAPGHPAGGEIDQIYRYVGADTSETDLGTQDYTTSDWEQDATVERPFVMRFESPESTPAAMNSPYFKPDAPNELIVNQALNNPANAASMIVTFDMPKGGNDWWWAVDNIAINADVTGDLFAGIDDQETWNFDTGDSGSGLTGDYDGDGLVDDDDRLVWKDTFGSTTDLRADGNSNGVIDGEDFIVWRNHVGNSTPAVARVPRAALAVNTGQGDAQLASLAASSEGTAGRLYPDAAEFGFVVSMGGSVAYFSVDVGAAESTTVSESPEFATSPWTLALDHVFARPGAFGSSDRLVNNALRGDVVGEIDEIDELALSSVLEDEDFGLFG